MKLQFAAIVGVACMMGQPATAETFDRVIVGGRVMDPESGLDAVRDVGIRDGKIAAISENHLTARETLDARGLVVAPGFIDLHAHQQSYESATYQAKDGVTTRLELEAGVADYPAWVKQKSGKELIHYGASARHTEYRNQLILAWRATQNIDPNRSNPGHPAYDVNRSPLPPDALPQLRARVLAEIGKGAIGIGTTPQWNPGTGFAEMLELFRIAAQTKTAIFTHIRYASWLEPGSTLEAVQEMIANAAITGAPVHIEHVTSMAMGQTSQILAIISDARRRGVDVSAEMYPWGAAQNRIRAPHYDAGWEQRFRIGVDDLQSVTTGKRLTQADFVRLRQAQGDEPIIMHLIPELAIQAALQDERVMIASDGTDLSSDFVHPRSAGTYARVLGHYVREKQTLPLMSALAKMSLLPARRLESFVPAMKNKGRVRVGTDADLVVFDPTTVREKADYLAAKRYSEGFRHVLVAGIPVVRDDELVQGVFPGQPIFSAAQMP